MDASHYNSIIEDFLKSIFFEDWMDESDWKDFVEELEKTSNISIQSLSNDLKIGVENGYSVEYQMDIIKNIIFKDV